MNSVDPYVLRDLIQDMSHIEKEKSDLIIRLTNSVNRVLALHYEINGPADDKTCNECAVDEYNYPEWPCNTIKALDGEQLHKLTENEHGNTCRDVLCGGCVEFVEGEQ